MFTLCMGMGRSDSRDTAALASKVAAASDTGEGRGTGIKAAN